MDIPLLGSMTRDRFGNLVSAPIAVPVFGGTPLPFEVNDYEDDPVRDDFDAAIRTFLALDRAVLDEAGPAVFDYYLHTADLIGDELEGFPRLAGPGEVWDHVEVESGRSAAIVERDGPGEPVYVSVECECSWEPEHGLQLVFRDGARVTKVGPYDGHLTNASAYGRDDLKDVIYVR